MDDGDLANDLPDWWPYPVQCGHGHPWSPGHVIVSYLPCPCRADEGISGHTVVHCTTERLPLGLVPPATPPARRGVLPRRWGARRGAIITRRRATQSLLKHSTPRQLPVIQLRQPTPAN